MARSRSSSNASNSSSESFIGAGDFMEEPTGYRPATPPPTVVGYKRRHYGSARGEEAKEMNGPEEVQVGLVSGHPLWGHILYPAALALSRFLELHSRSLLHSDSVGQGKGKGKAVLELGAGGGLPGLVAALEGAGEVVITDFPDPSLVSNLARNVEMNIGPLGEVEVGGERQQRPEGVGRTQALGFTWGSSTADLLAAINPAPASSFAPRQEQEQQRKFDLILLSDLVFNHSQHPALLASCLSLLASPSSSSASSPAPSAAPLPPPDLTAGEGPLQTPAVLCFFSHHRPTPQLIEADLGILDEARKEGWTVRKVWEDKAAGPAFPEDSGDLAIRGTVHGYAFTRP